MRVEKIEPMKLLFWTAFNNICQTESFIDVCRTFNFTYQLKIGDQQKIKTFLRDL